MHDVAIQVEGLTKRYRLGQGSATHHTIGERVYDLVGTGWRRLRGQQAAAPKRQMFQALDGVDFAVNRGQVLGVIGRNGAGKSTLLKILARITEPSAGRATIHGRVGSLLEVGTGFHPELTGRENTFLNGAILGMRRREIAAKFDEIVAFAELDRFIDTPVKRYSSGMYVRLAFAVAAHLEPEVLLIDEVLAVGDAGFQKKCLGKMQGIAEGGRTVLFVSHDMGAVTTLCDRVLLMEGGKAVDLTAPQTAVEQYLRLVADWREDPAGVFDGPLRGTVAFNKLTVNGTGADQPRIIRPYEPITLEAAGVAASSVPRYRTTFSVYRDNVRILSKHDAAEPTDLPAGGFISRVTLPPYLLRPGDYRVALGGYRDGMKDYLYATDLIGFTVTEQWSAQYDPIDVGLVNVPGHGSRDTLPPPEARAA
ncbi:MAG: ABC transporter ATP-binding protein [Planctomycetota bacterium]